jgi:hypothetical protein
VTLKAGFSPDDKLGIFDEGDFIQVTFSQFQDLERRKMVVEDENARHPDQRFLVRGGTSAEDVRAYLSGKYWRCRNKDTKRFYNVYYKGDRRESEATVWLQMPPSAPANHEFVDETGNPAPPPAE